MLIDPPSMVSLAVKVNVNVLPVLPATTSDGETVHVPEPSAAMAGTTVTKLRLSTRASRTLRILLFIL